MSNRDTGRYIALLRKEKRLTQQQLADILGVTNKAVSKWETGQGMPDISLLPALAAALGTTIDAIVQGGLCTEALPSAQEGITQAEPGVTPTEPADTQGKPKQDMPLQDKPTRKKHIFTFKRVLGVVLLLAGLCGGALLVAFNTMADGTHVEYLFDFMPYLLWAAAFLLASGGVLLLLAIKPRIKLVAGLCCLGAAAVFAVSGLGAGSTQSTYLELSPGGTNLLVLKHNEQTGQTSLYRQRYGVLAKLSSDFPYPSSDTVKTQWLAEDICAVTYRSPDGSLHQFVATYGSRGSNIYVTSTLFTTWRCELVNDTSGWGLEVRSGREGEGGIVVKNAGQDELYTWSDCVQFGTLALALCRDGLPQWTLALNDDFTIDPVSGIAMSGSTISLCAVSMEKTMPITFVTMARTTSEPEIPHDNTAQQREDGERLRDEMLQKLADDPTLTDLENSWGMWKVETDATDIFEITRLAFEAEVLVDNGSNIEAEYQITSMRLVAGGDGDWLVEINSRLTASSTTETETVTLSYEYRIMQAQPGLYLVARVTWSVDGTVGLTVPDVEQSLETDGDERYHFYIPADWS